MPKIRTHTASKKRFKRVGGNKIKRGSAFRRHLLTKKSANRKRSLRMACYICDADLSQIKRLIPYSS